MSRRLINLQTRQIHQVWLYSVVYTKKISVYAVLLLLLSFMIQPFHEAFAAEEIVLDTEPVAAEPVKEQVQEIEVEVEPVEDQSQEISDPDVELEEIVEEPADESEITDEEEANEIPEDSLNESEAGSSEDELEDENSNNETESSEDEEDNVEDSENQDTDTASSTQSEAETDNASSTDEVISETGSTTPVTGGGGGGSNPDDDESEDSSEETSEDDEQEEGEEDESEIDLDTESDLSATTTDDLANEELDTEDTPVVEAEVLKSEENFYQFSRQSCAAVGDGTFHCSSTDVGEFDTQSGVYSALGVSGNMEIFLKTSNGDVNQITDNEFDDTSPYYDAETLQVVWQRLIDDRHQVILYDIAKDKESQLTFSRTNNMEPKVSADGVVWQAWDNNDWEIMYFDGIFTDQITDNLLQDVTPVIKDSYILWTVIGKSDQEAKVYSLQSGEILTIDNHEGGIIENPRFVLVYDTKFDNGDVITQGFDPSTGISEPISATPAPQPVNIPFPDTTGEIRALIQNKSFSDDEFEKDLIQSDGSTSTPTTTSDTLDLSSDDQPDQEVNTDTQDLDEDPFVLTEFDLILTDTEVNFDEIDELSEIDEIIDTELDNSQTSNTQD